MNKNLKYNSSETLTGNIGFCNAYHSDPGEGDQYWQNTANKLKIKAATK